MSIFLPDGDECVAHFFGVKEWNTSTWLMSVNRLYNLLDPLYISYGISHFFILVSPTMDIKNLLNMFSQNSDNVISRNVFDLKNFQPRIL